MIGRLRPGRARRWDPVRDATELVPCPLCGESRRGHVHTDAGWRYVRCFACAHVYLSPRPSAEALRAAYDGYLPADEAAWRARYAAVVEDALDALGPPGSLLEVGSGFGQLLETARGRGWIAEGLDVAPADGVAEGTIEDAPTASFDAVVALYLLEHLPDPRGFLREARRVLAPGGRLLLRVPDTTPLVRLLRPFGAADGLYHAPWHLHDFAPARLGRLLAEEGFRVERSWSGPQGWPLSRWAEGVRGTSRSTLATSVGSA